MKYKKFYFAIFACFLLFRVLPVEASSYGQGAIAGYTYEEPGRWERTDMLYFGPLEETLQVGGLTISAVWTENYKDMVYTFTATNGAQSGNTTGSAESCCAAEYFTGSRFSRRGICCLLEQS